MKIDNESLNLSSKSAMSYVNGLAKFLKDEYREKGFKVEIYEHNIRKQLYLEAIHQLHLAKNQDLE